MNSFVKRLYGLALMLIGCLAFVEGMYALGHEMGPAASVREQYRIFLIQRAEAQQSIREGLQSPRSM